MSMDIGSDGQHAKALTRHFLQQIVATVSEGVLVLDALHPELAIVYANPAYERLTGYRSEELVGRPWKTVQRDDDGCIELAKLRSALGRGEECELTILDVTKDGSTWFSSVEVSTLADTSGETRYFLCRQRPVEDRSAHKMDVEVNLLQRELGHARQRIASLSRTEPDTGLLTYGHFIALLSRDLAVARREARDISVVVFDVVEIDVYRKTFGSNAADSALRMISAQVAGAFRRAGDLCARRNDTMLVVATRGQDDAHLEALASRVADKVRGLGLHNPKAQSSRHLIARSATAAVEAGNEDAEALVERCCAELAGDFAMPLRAAR
jgi:PAS domain S-box-containing protein